MKIAQALKRSVLVAPVTAATTVVTANLDTLGADYAVFNICLGARLNTNATSPQIRLLESDSTTASTFATFNSAFTKSVSNASSVVVAYCVDLRGRKRYQRIEITPDSTTNGPVISAVIAELKLENLNSNNANNADVVVVG